MSELSTGLIYGIFCPETNMLRYIGATTGSEKQRLSSHISGCERSFTPMSNWIKCLKLKGLHKKIQVKVIEDNIPFDKLHATERAYIQKYEDGNDLLNQSHSVVKKQKRLDVSYVQLDGKAMKLVYDRQTEIIKCNDFRYRMSISKIINLLLNEYAEVLEKEKNK